MSNPTQERPRANGPDVDEESRLGGTVMGSRPIIDLAPYDQQALEKRRIQNQMAALIGALSWGSGMGLATRRGWAEWCHTYGLDPATEVDNLGGNPYPNGEYYLRRLGELRSDGIITDAWLEHIQDDRRLLEVADDNRAPTDLREQAARRYYQNKIRRAEFNVPEQAAAVCVATAVLKTGGKVVTGCKWGGNGTSVKQPRHGGAASPNPVVESNPTLSVETQAVRRLMRQIASYVPRLMAQMNEMELAAEHVGASTRVEAAMVDDQVAADQRIGRPVIQPPGDDPYGLPSAPAQRALGAGAAQPVQVPQRDRSMADLYESTDYTGGLPGMMVAREPQHEQGGRAYGGGVYPNDPRDGSPWTRESIASAKTDGTLPFDATPAVVDGTSLANADPGLVAELQNDLELLTPEERIDYETRKARGEIRS